MNSIFLLVFLYSQLPVWMNKNEHYGLAVPALWLKPRATGRWRGTGGLKWRYIANCCLFYSSCIFCNAVWRRCRRCALANTTKLCTSCRSDDTPWRCCRSVLSREDSSASRPTAAEFQLWFQLTRPSLRSSLVSSVNRSISSVRALRIWS